MKRTLVMLIAAFALAGLGISDSVWAGNQVLLGERQVRDIGDTDTIKVGKSHGVFTGLRVKTSGSAVEFKRVVVHFKNGTKQVFKKNKLLRKGDSLRVDLQGDARYIDKVVFHYEARSKGWKGAKIKLFGVR